MLNKNDYLNILRQIKYSSKLTQRELATKLGFSLGKLNYCLKELQKKGLIKISNFEKNQNKLRYLYILTPKGMTRKTILTIEFMKLKMKEYDQLKKDLKNDK
jgi:EPS-associated MarR family transcriptional regulator